MLSAIQCSICSIYTILSVANCTGYTVLWNRHFAAALNVTHRDRKTSIHKKQHELVPEIFCRITANLFDLFGNLSTFCCFIETRNVQHFATILQSNDCSSTQLIFDRFKWTHSMLCISEIQTVFECLHQLFVHFFHDNHSYLMHFFVLLAQQHTHISNAVHAARLYQCSICIGEMKSLRVSFCLYWDWPSLASLLDWI